MINGSTNFMTNNMKLFDSNVQAGSGSLPIENIKSVALVFSNLDIKPSIISSNFRKFSTPTIGYITGNKFFIDFKAIPSNQVNNLIESIKNCLQ